MLPTELKAAADALDEAAFATASSFETAMHAAVGRQTFVEHFPLAGKNAMRAIEESSFRSRNEFMQAVDSFH